MKHRKALDAALDRAAMTGNAALMTNCWAPSCREIRRAPDAAA
jgi:hypothetical protein